MQRRKLLQGLAALGGWWGFAKDLKGKPTSLRSSEGTGENPRGASLNPLGLKCEYSVNPLAVDVRQPRLSWRLEARSRAQMQSDYQILVASTPEKLATDVGDLWDSGRVASGESIQIDYKGKPLESFQSCRWKVRVWDQQGAASPYSDPAHWEMGILDDSLWRTKWITAGCLLGAKPSEVSPPEPAAKTVKQRAPLFRRSFRLKGGIKQARAYVCGLGYYELYINGARVGDSVLDPAQTDYEKRALYVAYDITEHIQPGENAVGIMLGNGWYHQDRVWREGKYSVPGGTDYGVPRVFLQMRWEYEDGSIETLGTDESWRAAPGPVLDNNIYAGEEYDARLEIPAWSDSPFNDRSWKNASLIEAPTRDLQVQSLPPIKRIKTLHAVDLSQPKPGIFVYDFGQNFAGWARLRVTAPGGTKITLRFAESLAKDGMIDPASTGVFATGVVQTDTYVARGGGEEVWEPRFTYHGFRYVEMTGYPGTPSPSNLEGVVVHCAVDPVGEFECSDAMLNRIHETALWTEVSNLYGVPTDCPARERCGWLGDAQVSAEMTICNFDMAQFWRNFITDIRTSEENGLPTMVAPGKRKLGVASPDWGTATAQLPWYMYLHYGDKRILEEHYHSMKRWVEHLLAISHDLIVSEGLGDWCPPGSVEPTETPIPLTSTAYFFLDIRILCDVARILGRKDDAATYLALGKKIEKAFNQKFYAPAEMSYGSQTADSLALGLGLVPAGQESGVASSLARDVIEKHHGHLSTGITGSRWLCWALSEYGHGDVALEILRQKTYPSIGYLFSLGATTLWETWGEPELDVKYGTRSHNHPMQGGFDAWFYQGLAGICPDADRPGYKHLMLRPQVLPGLQSVRAEYNSMHGKIVSAWTQEKHQFMWFVSIPANTTATVHLPCDGRSSVTESGREISQVAELSVRGTEPGRVIVEIGSGNYSFGSRLGRESF